MLDVNPESWLVVLGYREKVRGHEQFCYLQKIYMFVIKARDKNDVFIY